MRELSHPLLILILILLPACFGFDGKDTLPTKEANRQSYAVPGKDHLALVGGKPLTLTAFSAIRDKNPSASANDAYWIGVASLALQSANPSLSLNDCVMIARYGLGFVTINEAHKSLSLFLKTAAAEKNEVRRTIEDIIARTSVVRNERVLAEITQDVR